MNYYSKTSKRKTQGFILVITLFAVLILATLIIGFVNMTSIDLSLIKNHMFSSQAYYIAEAGVADAINQIRLNGLLGDIQWESTFPPSTSNKYNVSVSENSTVINSTGLASVPNFSRTLEVKISITGSSAPYNISINQWKELTL